MSSLYTRIQCSASSGTVRCGYSLGANSCMSLCGNSATQSLLQAGSASGILGIVAGAILVLFPGISLFALTLVVGVWLVVFGAVLIGRALHLRSATRAVRTGAGLHSPGV